MQKSLFVLTSIYHVAVVLASTSTHAPQHKPYSRDQHTLSTCRDRLGNFRPDDFRVSTCSMCFVYLFPTFPHIRQIVINGTAILVRLTTEEIETTSVPKSDDSPSVTNGPFQSVSTRKTSNDAVEPTIRSKRNHKHEEHSAVRNKNPRLMVLRPDVQRDDSMEEICHLLTSSQCRRWQQCCHAANHCCDRQKKLAEANKASISDPQNAHLPDHPEAVRDQSTCPITWDGYSCVQETSAGKTAHLTCPSFISLYELSSSASATRLCLSNATWWKSPVSHLEWTDYSQCLPVDFESMRVAQILAIACNCISIGCVIPSLLVFLLVRPLRRQPRIQLHISLFVAMLLSAIFGLLWERLVMYDMLVTPLLHNFVHTHPNSCRFLNMAARLSDTFTFFWMFCQGFHLQWLMVRSFKPFHALGAFSFIGWGIPTILIITYITVRYFHFDEDPCWIQSTGVFEWLIDGPTMACIALNLVFLAIILRALWSQLGAHTDHVGPVRRTVRALFLLIPLFGLQQFCIIYRPHVTNTNYVVYDVISAIVVNSQGALVAVIFCFMNDEVQTHVKHHARRWLTKFKSPCRHQSRQGDPSHATNIPMDPTHRPSLISTVLPTE